MEEPKAPERGTERRVRAEGMLSGEGHCSNLTCKSMHFHAIFCVKQYAESDDVLPLKYRVGNRYSLLYIFLVGI